MLNRQHKLAQILLRSWPFPQGTGLIVKRFFEHLRFDEAETVVETIDGFKMRVIPNEHIGRYLYLTGQFDRSTFEVLQRHAEAGDTLLDIGANIGYMSASFLAKVPGSRVIAVEPQPGIVDLLRTNLAAFDSRGQVAPVALSDRNGHSSFSIDLENRGASRLTTDPTGTVTVETWTPEHLLETFQPERIDIIKIDVEGHEETVFKALDGLLKNYKPRLIMFEDHTDKASPSGPIGSHLISLGYKIYGVKKRLTRLEFPEIKTAQDCRYNDYIALWKNGAN